MAENDWYEKHKKDVAVALKKGKGAPKEEGVPCTLVRMKDNSALLCANVSAPKANAMVMEAKKAGGKVLSAGSLYMGENGPTFAVSDGSTSIKVLFSTAAADAAGSPLNVIIVDATPPPAPPGAPPASGAAPAGAAPAATAAKAPGASPPPAPAAKAPGAPPAAPAPKAPAAPSAAPAVNAEAFKARFKEVVQTYQQAAQKAPDRKIELDGMAGKAASAAKSGDYAGGIALLNGLAKASEAVLKGPTPGTQPSGDPSAAFKDKFKALRPSFDKALLWAKANAPERAEALEGLQAQAFDEAKAKRFDAALPTLDQLSRAVEAALMASEGKEVKPPDAPVMDAEAFKNRLKAVLPLYQEAIAKAPDRKADLTKLATDATNAGKGKDFAGAVALLDQLEARSKTALRTAGVGEEIEKATGKGNVALRAKMQDWKKAKAKAAAAIGKLKKEILADPEAQTLSNWEQIKKGAQGINELMTAFDEFDLDLSDALQAIDDAPTLKDREEPKKEALAVVQKYQQALSDELYDLLDNGSYGEGIKVKAVIADELNALAGVLA